MKKLYTLILSAFLIMPVFPQDYYFTNSIGEFENAASFYINPAGFIYVTDGGSYEVYKLDTIGNKLKEIGGYGWDNSAFDSPVDVYATTLNVYVTDKNNHRIQRLDKDLNFVSILKRRESDNRDEQFGYPQSCATSPQGDLYILDSENKRVMKFDLFGNFIQNFGGYDWGDYELSNPKKLSASQGNNIFVLDEKRVIIYDQFGSGIGQIKINEDFINMNIVFSNITLNTGSDIYAGNLRTQELTLNKLQLEEYEKEIDIVSSFIFNNKLYVLTPLKILIFEKPD